MKMKTYTIKNKKTGKTKKVSEKDLHKYGLGGNTNPYMAYGGMYDMGGLYPMGGYVPMAQDGDSVDMTVAPSMLQPVDQTQLPLRPGVAEQVPYTIRGEYSAKEAPTKKSTGPSKYSIVDYMISMGLDPSKESRKAFAKKLGIKDYDFKADQNIKLIGLLKDYLKTNKKISEHQQYTFPESLSSNVMSSPVAPVLSKTSSSAPFVGGHAEQPYEESPKAVTKTSSKGSPKNPYWGGQYESNVAKELEGLSDRDLSIANNRTFFIFDPIKSTALEKEMNRRGYKNWDDLVKSAYSSSPKIRATGAPLNFMSAQVPYFSDGGCMECGGKMQNGGTPFQNYLQKYPSRPATDTLVGTPFYGDTPVSEQLRVNDLLKARQQTPNLQNRWGAEEKMNPSIYDWDPTLYPNITPANKPFKPVMQEGGKLPKEILRARLESHMSPSQAQDYIDTYGVSGYLDEAGDGKWIQKAINPAHKGYCTPMTKATCTPRRKALAKTLKKMAKSRSKADGGYIQGQQYEMDDNQIAKLKAMGYKIKEV